MNELDDHELLRQFVRDGSEAAFAILVSRYVNLVYSAAMRFTGNTHHAEEITQAVFIVLARKADDLQQEVVLSGWLYHTARLVSANFVKGELRRQRREQEAYMQSTLNEQETEAAWEQISPLLDEAMGELGEADRNAVVLRFFQKKTAQEIAVTLQMTEAAVHKRVARAMEKLRRFFVKRGVASTTTVIVGAVSANSVQAAPPALASSILGVSLAKGAAASSSTLILAKGTLKLMAWTKTKIAVAAAALFLTAATVVTLASHIRHAPPAPTGRLKLPTGNVTPMIRYGYSRYGILLASDGSLWSWGEERLGWPVLGLAGNVENTVSLRRIGHDSDWVNISAGDSHSLAIKSDGTLWAWGGNFDYQLGDGTKITRPTPVASIPGNDWKQAAAGGANSFGLKTDGTLWAWGNNWGSGKSGQAVQVGSSTNWAKIWAGSIQTLGLQNDGTLWFWGSLTGDSKETKFAIPTQVSADTNWTDACFGYFTMFAIKSDGTLWSWGREARFYTGANDASGNATPRQVGTESDWQSCASSPGWFYHILQKKDGSLWALDASDHRTIKADNAYKPIVLRKIDLQANVAAFMAGEDDVGVVLTRDGEVWTWGRVIGEFAQKDYMGPNREVHFPNFKTINKPWRLSILDEKQ